MNSIQFNCLSCGQAIVSDTKQSGQRSSCPNCQSLILIPFVDQPNPCGDIRNDSARNGETDNIPIFHFYGKLVIFLTYISGGIMALQLLAILVSNDLGALIGGVLGASIGFCLIRIQYNMGKGIMNGERIAIIGILILSFLGALINAGAVLALADKGTNTLLWSSVPFVAAIVLYSPLAVAALKYRHGLR